MKPRKEAIEFCKQGRKYTKKDCWAVRDTMDQFRYKMLIKLGNE